MISAGGIDPGGTARLSGDAGSFAGVLRALGRIPRCSEQPGGHGKQRSGGPARRAGEQAARAVLDA
jgi:hypothetical protein